MTLEQLLDCSAEKLKAMTDKELEEFFMPYFNVTRPEQAAKRVAVTVAAVSPEMQQKLKLAASMGIDISALKKKLGKK